MDFFITSYERLQRLQRYPFISKKIAEYPITHMLLGVTNLTSFIPQYCNTSIGLKNEKSMAVLGMDCMDTNSTWVWPKPFALQQLGSSAQRGVSYERG